MYNNLSPSTYFNTIVIYSLFRKIFAFCPNHSMIYDFFQITTKITIHTREHSNTIVNDFMLFSFQCRRKLATSCQNNYLSDGQTVNQLLSAHSRPTCAMFLDLEGMRTKDLVFSDMISLNLMYRSACFIHMLILGTLPYLYNKLDFGRSLRTLI